MKKWIVINGNPVDGFKFYGSFETSEQAQYWGIDNFDESGFCVALIQQAHEVWHEAHEASQNNT